MVDFDNSINVQRFQTNEKEIKLLRDWKDKAIERIAVVEKVEESIPDMKGSVDDLFEIIHSLDKRIGEAVEKEFEAMKKKGIALLVAVGGVIAGGSAFGPGFLKKFLEIFGP